MKIFDRELNLKDKNERKRAIDLLLISKMVRFPFFNNILMNICDIEDVDDEFKQSGLAYTFYDHQYGRVKICLNFDWIEDGMPCMGGKKTFDEDQIMSLIYHELFHNYFHHFIRHERYREEYPKLANIVEDYYCNEFLIRMFPESKKLLNDEKLGSIMYDSLNDIAKQNCGTTLPFSGYDDKPLEGTLIEWFLSRKSSWKKPDVGDGSGSGKGKGKIDDHDYGSGKSKQSMEKANEARKGEGKDEFSKEEFENLAGTKIEQATQMSGGKQAASAEEDALRHKIKILKRDPFLNFVKIKNMVKNVCSKNVVRSYARPNRKKQSTQVVFKGKQKEKSNRVVIGIDVSGSVSDKELEQIYSMLDGFLAKNKETLLDIIYWSSCEVEPKHFHRNITTTKDLLKLKIHTSGGTQVEFMYKFLQEAYKGEMISFMNITDGYWWKYPPIPKNVTQHFIVLTEKAKEEELAKLYPNATVKVCKVYP